EIVARGDHLVSFNESIFVARIDQQSPPLGRQPWQGERDRFRAGVEQEEKSVIEDGLSSKIRYVRRIPGELQRECLHKVGVPCLIRHFLPGRIEPHDVLDLVAANLATKKEFRAPKYGMIAAKLGEFCHEFGEFILPLRAGPA